MLTLSEAIKTGRLEDFIRQEEARSAGPVDRSELDAALERVIKSPLRHAPVGLKNPIKRTRL